MLRKLSVVLQKQGGYGPPHKSLSSTTSAAGGSASSFADLLKKGNLDGSAKVIDTQPATQGKSSPRKWVPNSGKTVPDDNNGSSSNDVTTTGRSIPPRQRKAWIPKSSAGSTAASAAVSSSRTNNASNKFSFSMDDALTNGRRSNNREVNVGSTAGGGNETGSVRDSLRRAAQRHQSEHKQGGGGPDGGMRVMGDSTAAEEVSRIWQQQSASTTSEHGRDADRTAGNAGVLTDARAVRADILDHIANREMKPDPLVEVDVGNAGIPLDEVEITEGELRYRQYQERLRIEKEQFRRKLPPTEQGPRFRRAPSSSGNIIHNTPY